MESTIYSFNPYDWTSITPLFDALSEMPVTDDSFLDWLAQWNELDIEVWDAYTQLKRPAYLDTRDHHAQSLYQAYVQELYSTYLGHTNTLINRALVLHPEPPTPTYQQLWRRWRNQATLFAPANLPIQAEISHLEGLYRDVMNRYEGTPESPLAYWMDRRDELNDLMLRLLKLRRALAQTSGLPTFLAYRWRELNRLDYSIAECQSFHRAVEKMVPAIVDFRSRNPPLPAFPEVDDIDKLTEGVERILRQVDPTFGDIFHAMRDGYLDLGRRPHKAATSESWFFPRTGMPYIHVASANAGIVFHESGHSIHDYLSFQAQGSLWNLNGPEEYQEFVATSMDMLCWPYYAQTGPGGCPGLYSAAESAAVRQNLLRMDLEFSIVCVMQDAFEHWVYSEAPENVTPTDLDAKWLELKQRFQPWDDDYASEAEKMTGWQRNTWSLFRMPLYMITYPMANIGTCQLGHLAETDRAGVVKNYKTALTLGNTLSLPALFRVVGVDFPFTDQVVEKTVQSILDQSLTS